METLVTLVPPTATQQLNWPGGIATAAVYGSSEKSDFPAWRFGELHISGSGSMPQLEGFSRHLALLSGEGLLIMHGPADRTELLAAGEQGAMNLEHSNEVELIDGPVRLLDIVVDSRQFTTEAVILGGDENMHAVDADVVIAYGLEGERMHCIMDEHEFTLNSQQWARIDNPPKSDIQCTDGRVLILTINAV